MIYLSFLHGQDGSVGCDLNPGVAAPTALVDNVVFVLSFPKMYFSAVFIFCVSWRNAFEAGGNGRDGPVGCDHNPWVAAPTTLVNNVALVLSFPKMYFSALFFLMWRNACENGQKRPKSKTAGYPRQVVRWIAVASRDL